MNVASVKKPLANVAKKTLWDKIRDIRTVTIGIHYTTKSQPDIQHGKEFTFDVEKTGKYLQQFTKKFKIGEKNMADFQYKIIWVNEMGEEQIEYAKTEEERNTKMQALADDGYSPVWRKID